MVKYKSRYILSEIIGINSKGIHTAYRFKPDIISKQILEECLHFFGESGLGQLKKNFQVKYVNEITNLVIIRVGRDELKLLHSILTLLCEIDNKKIKARIIHISGTIKKIEEKAKDVISFWLNQYELNELKEITINKKNSSDICNNNFNEVNISNYLQSNKK